MAFPPQGSTTTTASCPWQWHPFSRWSHPIWIRNQTGHFNPQHQYWAWWPSVRRLERGRSSAPAQSSQRSMSTLSNSACSWRTKRRPCTSRSARPRSRQARMASTSVPGNCKTTTQRGIFSRMSIRNRRCRYQPLAFATDYWAPFPLLSRSTIWPWCWRDLNLNPGTCQIAMPQNYWHSAHMRSILLMCLQIFWPAKMALVLIHYQLIDFLSNISLLFPSQIVQD